MIGRGHLPLIDISGRLKLNKASPREVLLDPNNPRLMATIGGGRLVPDEATAKGEVQQRIREQMMRDEFAVKDLRDSIVQVGFLPVDKIVVRRLKDGGLVVLEGNRRLAALKQILAEVDQQILQLEPHVLATIDPIEVLELDTTGIDAREIQLVLQGVRHVSGVKSWGPYQQAEVVVTLQGMGLEPRQIADSIGMKVGDVNRLRRAYSALRQMAADEEHGEYAEPEMFSYFEEAIKIRAIREWLGWDDENEAFANQENLRIFYESIVPDADFNNERKIPRAIAVRDLPEVLRDPKALEVLKSPGKTIREAVQVAAPPLEVDWQSTVADAIRALGRMSGEQIEAMSDQDRQLLQQLRTVVERRLAMADTAQAGG